MALQDFHEQTKHKELSSLRTLNVMAAVIITVLGFVFEFAYHDAYILSSGLLLSTLFTINYYLSVYNQWVRNRFTNVTYFSIFLMHGWAVYVTYLRSFQIEFLLPVALSTFIFSLIFDKFYKSFLFIFLVTSSMLLLMLYSGEWSYHYTIAIASIYSGSILVDAILKRKNEYHREIERKEEQYSTLVENMNDGLLYLDKDLHITFVNDRFCEITGYLRDEVLNKHVLSIYAPGAQTKNALKFFDQLSSGRSARMESEIIRSNGKSIWIQMAGESFKVNHKITGNFRVVYADITALKNTQEQLKKREEGYRTFIGQSAVGIWRAEFNPPVSIELSLPEQIEQILNSGTIEECNDFMAKMYGFQSEKEIIGKNVLDFFKLSNLTSIEKVNERISYFVSNNYRIENGESKEIDNKGQPRYILNNIIGIIENNQLVRTWGVQTDITERKKTEKELLQTNQELDTFFYKASHDLKGPLASILGIVNLARLEGNGELSQYLGMIESSTLKLDNTLLELIELARTRKGVSKLNTVNMNILTDEVLYSLKHMNGLGDIIFKKEIDKDCLVISDQLLLQSILQNLIHNAINYRSADAPWIKISAIKKAHAVEIEVADNGKGIPPEIKDKVFNMFYRGHPDSSGSGLGLFIVKNAVDKLHGQITFESGINIGTCFKVTLPYLSNEN